MVSKGREPLEVQDFTGQTREAATSGLQDIGFTVTAQEEFSDSVPAGTVIRQDPASGTKLRGDAITIVVSKGPDVVQVPDVEGMRKNEAQSTLEAAGLQVQVLFGNGNFEVRAQTPSPGSTVKRARRAPPPPHAARTARPSRRPFRPTPPVSARAAAAVQEALVPDLLSARA